MPYQSKKPCNQSGCPELVAANKTYCPTHTREQSAVRHKRYDNNRDEKYARFYSSARWQKVRNIYIRNNPLCESCRKQERITAATLVDHIIPVQADYSQRLAMDNLQSLCRSCHAKKTNRDKEHHNL